MEENFSLKNYNTFGLDVSAKNYVEIQSYNDLYAVLEKYPNRKDAIILGGGSNILFQKDIDNLVIKNDIKGIEVFREDNKVVWAKVGAGEVWHDFVLWCVERNYGGVENLSLIPGSVGAAPIQNIGAYGVEIKDLIVFVEVLDKENLSRHIFTNHTCNFGYRDSFFKREGKNRFVILSVVFQLRKVPELNLTYGAIHEVLKQNKIEEPTIKDVSDAVISIRQSKLPDPKVIANCGSFFKNPEVSTEKHESLVADFPNLVAYPTPNGYKLAAGWLIEACGWKGKRIGDVGTHPKQALVIVNYGNAKAEDLIDFSAQIQAVVFEKFGVQLEPEVNFI